MICSLLRCGEQYQEKTLNFITKLFLFQRISRRRPKPKFFKSTSGSSSVEYSADVEDTGVRLLNQVFLNFYFLE